MLAIVDYGVGNLFSLSSSLARLNIPCTVTGQAEVLQQADRIILPGVGAFGDAMDKLRATGLVPALDRKAAEGTPILGICLGMQLLFEESFEYGRHRGLGYLKGSICPLAEDIGGLKTPHMGWNDLRILKPEHPLMKNTRNGDYVYFVHSYYAKNCEGSVAAETEYGVSIPAAVCRENICGCQFHPEKSSKVGLAILQAFAEL